MDKSVNPHNSHLMEDVDAYSDTYCHHSDGLNIPRKKTLRKKALFIPAAIRSHVIPTLYVAELMASEYDVFYIVANPMLAEIVTNNGFTPILDTAFSSPTEAISESISSTPYQNRRGYLNRVRDLYASNLDAHRKRKKELQILIDNLDPAVIIIDIFKSMDYLALYHLRLTTRILFCNPMLSVYRVGDFPIVSETNWPVTPLPVRKEYKFSFRELLKNPKKEIYSATHVYQMNKLPVLAGLLPDNGMIETSFTLLIDNVPELIFAPLEFELAPEIKKNHQHYLGLCTREGRVDTELDENFMKTWPSILAGKHSGQRLLYCSFGTYYSQSNKALLNFIVTLLKAVSSLPDVQLICSVNHLVSETLHKYQVIPSNIFFFRRVPQLEVLKHADVHITHGGLGSVKESISYGVPMLVYPLDLFYDQPGNGLKVEYHGLGLRGEFSWEMADNLKDKLTRLLTEPAFRKNITRFQQTCAKQYSTNTMKQVLNELFGTTI